MVIRYTGTEKNYNAIKKSLFKEVVIQHFVKDIATCDNNVIINDVKLIEQYLIVNNTIRIDIDDCISIEDGRLKSTFREK